MKTYTIIILLSLITFSCSNSKKATKKMEEQKEQVAELEANEKKGVLTQN